MKHEVPGSPLLSRRDPCPRFLLLLATLRPFAGRAARGGAAIGRIFNHVDNLPQRLPEDRTLRLHGRLRVGLHAEERADAHDTGVAATHPRQVP